MAAKMHKMFIGGKWVDAADGKTFEDMNPHTREVYAYLPAAKREDAKLMTAMRSFCISISF